MQVSTYVKESIDEAVLYSNLDHRPDVTEAFCTSPVLTEYEQSLDDNFFNVFNQVCGYYQFKRFAATCDEAIKLSFIEDATEYRLIEDGERRLVRFVINFFFKYIFGLGETSKTPLTQFSVTELTIIFSTVFLFSLFTEHRRLSLLILMRVCLNRIRY